VSRPTATGPLDPDAGQPEDDDAGTGQSARLGHHVTDVAGPVVSTSTKPRLSASASASTVRRWAIPGRHDPMTILAAIFLRLIRATGRMAGPRPAQGPGGSR